MDEDTSNQVSATVRRLMASGDTEAGAMIANLIGLVKQLERKSGVAPKPHSRRETARFTGSYSKTDDPHPTDARELMRAGGMRAIEWAAGERARDEEIKWQRRDIWLPKLEGWLADVDRDWEGDSAFVARSYLTAEIKRLRRCLGLVQSPEEIKAKTRERVRALRAKAKAAMPMIDPALPLWDDPIPHV